MHTSLATRTGTDVFWGEFAPHEHVVQLYADDAQFLDLLEAFVVAGLASGESVVLIATAAHLGALDERLVARGIHLEGPRQRDHYIAMDVDAVMPLLMVDGMPDEERLQDFADTVLQRARQGGRRLRVFGEMVAVLWAAGNTRATLRLEQLWDQLARQEGFPLFCAYPKIGFLHGAGAGGHQATGTAHAICCAHTRVLHG